MRNCGYAINLLLENCTSFREKAEIHALTESEVKQINNAMITNLYKSALDKGYVNFDSIPDSKGDITKYEGYDNLLGSINLLKELSNKGNMKIKELDVLETSLMNIKTYKAQFERGFALGHEFVMMEYNSLVYACVEATSTLISSYVDFVKKVDKTEFKIIKGKGLNGNLCLKNLELFNNSVKKGDFNKMMSHLLQSERENFVGSSVGAGVLVAGMITLSIIPLIRELIYYFYYSRMVVSEYLHHQSLFLEMNRVNIESSSLPAKEKNVIIKKQTEYAKQLDKLSEKIKVNSTMSSNKANNNIKNENKEWTLQNVQSSSNDDNGFALI